ncbi:MAG: hypothetical protein HY868_20040 [Chloroflexi bacterium]|nr:hypothetical protein [Chloroflexota bacterium]
MKTHLGVVVAMLVLPFPFAPVAHAQGPSGDNTSKLTALVRVLLDTLQGTPTVNANALIEQSKTSAAQWLNLPAAELFFLDFGNPALPLNQFAAQLAGTLLLLTPLYALGYFGILALNVWKERPIPNPILYGALVIGVMIFLAAFSVITQGVSELGRFVAMALGGAGTAMFPRATLLDTLLRVLLVLQKNAGGLAPFVLIVALGEMAIILVQLAYRGISMAVWRLFGVLFIPLSVLFEGVNPKTAGKIVSGFFEAWLDMVGKITLLLITLSLATSDAMANYVAFILPAGLLVVIVSWKFFGILFAMIRDGVTRAWSNVAPAAISPSDTLPASAEAARTKEIDEERRRMMKE